MATDDGKVQIRSYHKCFRLERRLHKIERWRIPVPYGVPVRGIVYAAVALVLVLIAGTVPVLGDLLGLLHPWFRYAVIPVGAGWALTRWKVDGRSAATAATAWLRWFFGPRRVASFRRVPTLGETRLGEVTATPDEYAARLRRGVVRGPATAVLRYPITARRRISTLHVRQTGGEPRWRGTQVRLRAGQRMVVG
jgi:hypothetical protein